MSDRAFDILVLRAGGWLVGADADTVRSVRYLDDADNGAAANLGVILGVRAVERGIHKPRLLAVARGAEERSLVVDQALGTRRFAVAELDPVPPVLRNFGAPAWWLGSVWVEEGLLLLLDLFELTPAAARTTA